MQSQLFISGVFICFKNEDCCLAMKSCFCNLLRLTSKWSTNSSTGFTVVFKVALSVEVALSAVYSLAPHSQFVRGARPHLYMDEQKRPAPERRLLSLAQAALGRLIPKGLVLALGMKAWSDDALAEYSMSRFVFVHWAARMSISEKLSSNFRAAGTNERLDFNLSLHTSCES